MVNILIIEDEVNILRGLTDNLKLEGYNITPSERGDEGLQMALAGDFDLLLLDIMLPGLNGHEVCRRLKKVKSDIPIIMLTARNTEVDKVMGLDIGADDYITKPFSIPELLARIRAVLRRSEQIHKDIDIYTFGKSKLDFKKYSASFDGKEVKLTNKEFETMRYLIEHAGNVVHRFDLLHDVWDYEHLPTTRTVDNCIMNLRKKLEEDPSNPKYLISVRSVGYKFEPN